MAAPREEGARWERLIQAALSAPPRRCGCSPVGLYPPGQPSRAPVCPHGQPFIVYLPANGREEGL